MPKTHLKKFYQEQEEQGGESKPVHLFPADDKTSSSKWLGFNNNHHAAFPSNNPLNQFAEITLATAATSSLTPQEVLLAQYLRRFQGLDLTPSSSPSPPPPAHNSRRCQPPTEVDHHNDLVSSRLNLLPPPQTAPEDLRVVAKKIDFPDSCSKSAGDFELEEDVEVAESVHSQRSTDSGGSSSGSHECTDCGKCYSTSSNLARHRQTHRSLEDKKARKCPHCEKTYVSMPAYSMHIRTHNQGCKCPFCGKCFSRPWLLQGHIRTHTGEKPFRCHICDKAFADKSNLRAHIQTHSNTKPFVCVKCNKAFALKSYLYKHEESSCMRMAKNTTTKVRRRSTGSNNSNSSVENNTNLFGHQLLLALSKARAAFESNA